MIDGVCKFFPDFQFSWVVPEFERHLQMEMDFVNEGKNAERIAKNFHHNPQISVPKIFWVSKASL